MSESIRNIFFRIGVSAETYAYLQAIADCRFEATSEPPAVGDVAEDLLEEAAATAFAKRKDPE